MKKKLGLIVTLFAALLLAGCMGQSANSQAVRIGALKGPTSIGLVKLKDNPDYTLEMATTADELLPKMVSGDLDIALVPANVASVLYNKTNGGVMAIDINTLGVLYAVSKDKSITDVNDLKGKTIYVTNKGTTPDYVLQYILTSNGMSVDDVTLEYKSEATEVAALLKSNKDAVGILPQPFVTVACIQDEELGVVLDLNKEWDNITGEDGSRLVTGVTVVRKEFLENNGSAVDKFMEDHRNSAEFVNANVDEAAQLVAETGIIEKSEIARKAIPNCNITYIDKQEMKTALSGYLNVLFNLDAKSIGGSLPGEDFYY